jgi:predicted nucleic acid-binding protein
VAFLVDTNVLVYRYDPRFPGKQAVAEQLLRRGLLSGEAHLSHQTLVEFVAAVRRPVCTDGRGLLTWDEAVREVDELLLLFPVLYPTAGLVRLATRAVATYGLSWFDAHLWAYAEFHGLATLYSEDLEHDRLYGSVRVLNPFRALV